MIYLFALLVFVLGFTIWFAYSMGKTQGTQEEKDKQNEIIKDAIKVRLDADVDKLRKKYKRGGSV